jgi:hypothetical protein
MLPRRSRYGSTGGSEAGSGHISGTYPALGWLDAWMVFSMAAGGGDLRGIGKYGIIVASRMRLRWVSSLAVRFTGHSHRAWLYRIYGRI